MNVLIINQHTLNFGDDIAGISLLQNLLETKIKMNNTKYDTVFIWLKDNIWNTIQTDVFSHKITNTKIATDIHYPNTPDRMIAFMNYQQSFSETNFSYGHNMDDEDFLNDNSLSCYIKNIYEKEDIKKLEKSKK